MAKPTAEATKLVDVRFVYSYLEFDGAVLATFNTVATAVALIIVDAGDIVTLEKCLNSHIEAVPDRKTGRIFTIADTLYITTG